MRHGVVERRSARRCDKRVRGTGGLEVVATALARAEQRVVLTVLDRHRLRGLEGGDRGDRGARVLQREILLEPVAVVARGRTELTLDEQILRTGQQLLDQQITALLRRAVTWSLRAPSDFVYAVLLLRVETRDELVGERVGQPRRCVVHWCRSR